MLLDLLIIGADPDLLPAGFQVGTQRLDREPLRPRDLLLFKDVLDDDLVGAGQGVRQAFLKKIAPQAPGARFEHRDDPATGIGVGQAAQNPGDGRRVVGEVAEEDRVPLRRPSRLSRRSTPLNVASAFSTAAGGSSQLVGEQDACGEVPDIVGTGQGRMEASPFTADRPGEIVAAAGGRQPG